MKNLIIVLSIVIMVNACSKNNCESIPISLNCSRTHEINPVCGCNTETYINKSYARCSQVDYTDGACSENIKDLVGKWDFLGFESEGACIGKVPIDQILGIEIEFTNQKFDKSFQYKGKALVNSYSGAYHSDSKKILVFYENSKTEIFGDFWKMQYEDKYFEIFYNFEFINYRIEGDFLQIDLGDLFLNKSDALIYKRKM